MVQHPRDMPFQHPAVTAALSARNAVAAEMAMAARAGNDPFDAAWEGACTALAQPGESAWILASDAYSRMREDLASLDAVDAAPEGDHAAALASIAVPVAGAGRSPGTASDAGPAPRPVRRPAARRRRERLATAMWFAIGGAGGLLLACAVRMIEMVVLWR